MNSSPLIGVRTVAAVLTLGLLGACSSGMSSGAASSGSPSAVASKAAVSVAADALLKEGEVSFCSDISAPPLEFMDASQKPVGAEVELGNALAASLGAKAVWVNTAFSGIIPALQAKQCDAILTQLYIKPAREKVVDFVPYLNSSNTIVVKAGDTSITGIDTLCGKKAAAQTGTTAADYYKGASDTCTSKGQKALDVRMFAKDTDALQQLKLGLVDSYGTTLETAAYLMKLQPGVFAMAGEPFGAITCGIATRKDNAAAHDALKAALGVVKADGTYNKILADWNLTGDALKG